MTEACLHEGYATTTDGYFKARTNDYGKIRMIWSAIDLKTGLAITTAGSLANVKKQATEIRKARAEEIRKAAFSPQQQEFCQSRDKAARELYSRLTDEAKENNIPLDKIKQIKYEED